MQNTTQWLQIIVNTSADNSDIVSGHLESLGALAVTLQDGADEALFETVPHSESRWQTTKVIGLFDNDRTLETLGEQFAQQYGGNCPSFEIELLEDDAWERRYLEHVKPMKFGQRLWICPSWIDATPAPDARIVSLDPGLAFGTGTHATTSLCLEWIDRCDFTDKTVIDYGCGSGILAVAAIKCGARHVDAVDHDEQALLATANNAEKNRCRDQIEVFLPDQFNGDSADIVFANILAGPLIDLAETLAAVCNSGANLILSGLLSYQYPALHNAYSPWFELGPGQEKEGWILIECQKR